MTPPVPQHRQHRGWTRKFNILGVAGIVMITIACSLLQSTKMLQKNQEEGKQDALNASPRETFPESVAPNQQIEKKESTKAFFLPDTDSFRPVTQLSKLKECMEDPNQPLVKISTGFEEYAFSSGIYLNSSASTSADTDATISSDHLACQFTTDQAFYTHFAHAMQQLYGCYTFFQQYHNAAESPVSSDIEKDNSSKILLMTDKVRSQLGTNVFVKGFLDLLKLGWGVEIQSPAEFQERKDAKDFTIAKESYVPGGYILSHAHELSWTAGRLLLQSTSAKSPAVGSGVGSSCAMVRPRIGILNRRPVVGRSIQNSDTLVNILKEISLNNEVSLEYFEGKSFKEQVSFFQRIDILLSPHGAQWIGLPFMVKKSRVSCAEALEIFPKGYLHPSFYGSLARNSGIGYSYLYLSDTAGKPTDTDTNLEQRVQVRSRNLCPSPVTIQESITSLIAKWRSCCQASINH